ncbi:tape measure protein [Bilophila wadsworthia]|uniref:tape measure protein n=1 Tax=Bilophila wadsworthia TaxID=35833 RepID=UPI00243257AE|nr:tape measure protein [Bilophila wadsworthia]
MARKTPGIYIAIRGDYSAFNTDMLKVKQLAKAQAEDIAKSINNAVSAADLSSGIYKITRELKTAQAALSSGAFKAQVSGLDEIAKAAGVSSKQLEGLTNSMLKSQAVASADRAFEYLQRNAGLSARELAKLRRELGDTQGALKTAMGALNTRSHSTIVSEMKDLVASYREVKNSADATANDVKRAAESMRGSLKRLASEARATKVSPTIELTPLQQALASVQRTTKLSTQEIERLSAKASQFAGKRDMEQAFTRIRNEAGLSTIEMMKLRLQLGDTSGAFLTFMSGAKAAAVPVLAVGAAFGVAAKASFDATLKLDSTIAAFESITGSSKAAQEQLSFIRELSDKLGLSFLDTAESAKTIFASAESTGLGMEKAQKAFQAVSTAGAALKLTTDQMNRLNLAVSQVISKGRPMAEEMRQQIGEVLPGAMGLFASSIGVTGKELDKMFQDGKTTLDQFFTFLDALQDKYQDAAAAASHSMQAELGRLKTSWSDFLVAVGDSDAFASITRGLSHALDSATGIIKESEFPNAVANIFKGIDFDISGPTKAAAQMESEIAVLIATVQKMPDPMAAATAASAQLEASMRSQSIALDHWLNQLPDEGYFKGIFGTIDELTPATRAAFDEIQNLIEETKDTHNFQKFSDQIESVGKRLEAEGEMTVRFRGYLERLQEVASRGVTVELQLEGKEKFLQDLREVLQAWRLQNDPTLATQKQWKADFESLIADRNQAIAKETQATIQAIERVNKVYDKSSEGKKKNFQDEIDAILKERGVFEQAVTNGIRTQKEFDDYSRKSAVAIKKLREDQRKIDKAGSKSAEAEANRATKALAVYNEELAKITMSSRELEQVKIEEKLAKIAKDAKLPAAEMEKLRKAMEQEADFKWMQDILSYADPAAAAVAKVDKEYEAFLRNVEYLKKTDPAKYTQLMTKAETEHEKALRKAERASKEQNEHLQEKLSFYKELEEMSGAFGLSLEVQNRLLDEQMEIFRDADIPENLIQTWRQYKDLMNSHDWEDGAQRAFLQYRADATDAAKGAEEAFSSLYSGMDSGWKSAWEQMIETSKVSLSSFRSVFASFLADLMHMAFTRPITVQIAGVVSGMFGTGGVAYAAGGSGGGAGGLLGNVPLSNLSSFLPDSFTSGLSGIMGATLPGTVSALTTPGAYTAGEILLMQGGGTTAGTVGGQAALMSGGLSLGSALMYGGLGSLGYSVLGGALGLPQSKYSGLTAGLGGALGAWGGSALGSSAGIAAGSALGSVVPVVGTVLGAIGGGLLGSLFGGGRRTHASVYSRMEDVGFSRDQQTYIDAFMGGAWYDRAGKSEAEPFAQGIAQVASQTAGSLLDIAGALPDQIRQNALSGLETSTWSAGRKVSDASWNFQWWEEGMAEERLEEAAKDMRNQMTAVAQQVFSNAGISQYFSSFDVTTDEGLQKASTALSAMSAVRSAIDAIKSPLSELEQQAQSAKAQLDAWTQGMKDSGVNAQYAAGLINDYRNAFINDYIKTLDESLHPLSAYAQAVKAANEAVDQRKKALEIIGATESQLAQVEAMRAEVVRQATEEMLRSFDQSAAQRWAAVNGNSDEVGRAISQANELRETIQQFGEGSAQVAELLKIHAAETVKAAQDAAKSEYDSLRAQMDALEQQRVQLQQQAIQEQINTINEQLSAAKTLKNTWEGLDKSLSQSRYNLFAGSANLDAENRLGTVQAEFRRLSGLALGGDSDAAGQLAGVGTSLLDLVKQTAGTEGEYLDAFWAVNAQLKSAQDAAGAQVSAADKELEALQGQLDVQNAALKQLQGQSATLEEIEKQIADLKPLLDAAGQKAGVKAFARGGFAMPGWAVVGEEGPELVNFSQPGRVYTAADSAALFRSATPRTTDTGSREEIKALRQDIYQLRRDMLISMSEVARFSRRTSDMIEAWDAEGMPGVRA